jgi:hypothetical protein
MWLNSKIIITTIYHVTAQPKQNKKIIFLIVCGKLNNQRSTIYLTKTLYVWAKEV